MNNTPLVQVWLLPKGMCVQGAKNTGLKPRQKDVLTFIEQHGNSFDIGGGGFKNKDSDGANKKREKRKRLPSRNIDDPDYDQSMGRALLLSVCDDNERNAKKKRTIAVTC
jgi:hypothetical protein